MYRETVKPRIIFLMLAFSLVFLFSCGCDKKTESKAAEKNTPQKKIKITNKPIKNYQKKLLNIAFKSASSISVEPHIKERSKTQQKVIEAYLELNQPVTAEIYTKQVKNWRMGLCYANLALYCAEKGNSQKANHYLKFAEKIADKKFRQQWRKDRIKVKIAQTHKILGNETEADKYNEGVVESEQGKLAIANAKNADANSFDEHVKKLDGLVTLQGFETTHNALHGYTELFKRFYENEQYRLKAEEKIKTSWKKLPVPIRIKLIMKLAEFALEKNDQNKALELVNEAQKFLDKNNWLSEDYIKYAAKIVELRFKAGDTEKAEIQADELLEKFKKEKGSIWNIYRTETVLPLAESYQIMEKPEEALSVYKIAIEESFKNPNHRPRAKDFSAICNSMALNNVKPDKGTWDKIHEKCEILGVTINK